MFVIVLCMNEFLSAIGATFNGQHTVFDAKPDSQEGICALAEYAVLKIEGPDTAKFLQGQITADTQVLGVNTSLPAAHCNAKGRAVASFRLIWLSETHYLCVVPRANASTLLDSLKKYAVFSKVKLNDDSDNWVMLGLSGPDAIKVAQTEWQLTDGQLNQAVTNSNGHLVFLAPQLAFVLVANSNALPVWQKLSGLTTHLDSSEWQVQRLALGHTDIQAEASEQFIPNALNLAQQEGISFTKGCYTGQEIVARLKYLGKEKSQLFLIKLNAPRPAGSAIRTADGSSAGELVEVVAAANTCQGLAILRKDKVDQELACEQASISILQSFEPKEETNEQ